MLKDQEKFYLIVKTNMVSRNICRVKLQKIKGVKLQIKKKQDRNVPYASGYISYRAAWHAAPGMRRYTIIKALDNLVGSYIFFI